jgi:hypothetical protein
LKSDFLTILCEICFIPKAKFMAQMMPDFEKVIETGSLKVLAVDDQDNVGLALFLSFSFTLMQNGSQTF